MSHISVSRNAVNGTKKAAIVSVANWISNEHLSCSLGLRCEIKKMSQIFYFLMKRDRRKPLTLLEQHGEFVVGFFVSVYVPDLTEKL